MGHIMFCFLNGYTHFDVITRRKQQQEQEQEQQQEQEQE